MKIVEVTWLDTVAASGWKGWTAAEAWLETSGMVHKSIGYLFKTTPEYVAIVMSYQVTDEEDGYDPNVNNLKQIPRSCVIEVRNVKTGRKVRLPC